MESPGASSTPGMLRVVGTNLPWLRTALARTHTRRPLKVARSQCRCTGRRGSQSYHSSPFSAHLCWPGLRAGMVAMGASIRCIECGRGCWRPCLGPHAPYQYSHSGGQLTSAVAVRYPPLNRKEGDNWIVGTHSSGGLEGLVGGYQLVVWKEPSKEFLHARAANLSAVIKPVLQDLIDINGDNSSVLVMCARNKDRDQLLTDSICQGHPQIKVQSAASSAGATATASIVNQPVNGHLNGRPTDPFDQKERCARCTAAATRAQSLTIIICQLDMAGIMGIMQVLAARARPIHQVYHGATPWQLARSNASATVRCGSGLMGYLPGLPLVGPDSATSGIGL